MQTSFIKDTKTTNEINKKREEASNLFGLGLVSLIAACSSDGLNASTGNDEIPIDDDTTDDTTDDDTTDDTTDDDTIDDDVIDTPDPDPLPFAALAVSDLSIAESGLMATTGGDTNSFVVELSDSAGATKTLKFAKGSLATSNKAQIYQLTDTEDQYDLVIAASNMDKAAGAEHLEGKIFIYWDAANIVDETSLRLEITGVKPRESIGTHAPEFLQLGGVADDNKLDMVVRSHWIDHNADVSINSNEGGIYILWDIADYQKAATNQIISLDSNATATGEATGATFGSLAIYGGALADAIGADASEFLQIGGKNDNYDMVIRGGYIDKFDAGSNVQTNEGAIFVLWDVEDYYNTASLHHTIVLDSSATGATFGSLAIYGAQPGDHIGTHAPDFLQLGGVAGDNKLDMVIRAHEVSTLAADEGAIYILWDVEDYHNTDTASLHHAITLDSSATGATFGSLVIHGAKSNDVIGVDAPEFLQIGGKEGDNKLDMVIRSHGVDTPSANAGAIFILWDVEDYYNTDPASLHHAITLDSSATGATSGSLAIYGARHFDHIGARAPEFLQIGGKDDNYDMVIRERDADKSGDGARNEEGVIYILWDVEDYYNTDPASLHHAINLDSNVTGEAIGATSGSLTIYGARPNNIIGTNPPDFLQLGGVADDNKLDMVIASHGIDKFSTTSDTNEGAVFVLWDVEDYHNTATVNKTIVLDASVTDATAGSLAIHGARKYDYVGNYAPEFLQIGGKDDNHDMVIRSAGVDKSGAGGTTNEGAIYVLWDVADYYSTDPANLNKVIDLAVAGDTTSGLLTIYGKATDESLGNDDNNVLYGSDDAGNKILTNIDGDAAGTKDIAFRDKDYTYILFGNKIAATGGDTEVDSKTIDLAKVVIAIDENDADGNFFSYDFDDSTPYTVTARVGYRFASGTGSDSGLGYTTLAEVQEAYDLVNPSSLSDADADLGAWDIA